MDVCRSFGRLKSLSCLGFGLIAASAAGAVGLSDQPKNLCTVTINSKEERAAFKQILEPLGYNVIELTEVQSGGATNNDSPDYANWFLESCKQKIQCDILVVSGHFGGTFFGESGIRLPVEILEENSCQEDCSGILKRPKEVFLFGCNTLAGKEKDQRTPEEYYALLISDGFTREQAEAATAFRYGPLGNSFADRMRRIFFNTPRIYGFTSIGPSGKNVERALKSYLKSSQDYYDKLSVGTGLNSSFLKALKGTAVTQVTGDKENSLPICYLSSPKVSYLEKLK